MVTQQVMAVPGDGVRVASVERRIADYTELEGAKGRGIYFRPERHARSEFDAVVVSVDAEQGGKAHPCELFDLSQNGLAFDWSGTFPLAPGEALPEVVVRVDAHEAYRGPARVRWVRERGARTAVGVSFIGQMVNVQDALHVRDVKASLAESRTGCLSVAEAPWRVCGHGEFKTAVAELRLFLEDAEKVLSELEARLPRHVVHGDEDSPGRSALIELLRSGFTRDVVEACARIERMWRVAEAKEKPALREFSRRHLDAFLMQSPWMHRARHKPLGYPGDFEVMKSVYFKQFDGPTLFARAMSLAFSWTPAAHAVRTRKDLMKAELNRLLDDRRQTSGVRILSIASGPAQEIFELLGERDAIDVPLEIVLFDQDERALAFCHERLSRLIDARWRGRVQVVHLHDSIRRLLRGSTVFDVSGKFDAVYACGLFDYFQPSTWVSLCRTLCSVVREGGSAYIGNMVPGNLTRWFMEAHLDWFLEYRTPEELLALADRAAPNLPVEILTEPTGVNPIVKLSC